MSGPSFGEACLLLVILLALSGAGLVLILIGGRGAEQDILLLGLVEILAITVVLLIGRRMAGVSASELFAIKLPALWMIPAMVPLAAACAVVLPTIEAWLPVIKPMPEELVLHQVQLLYPGSPWMWLRVLGSVALAIPIGEELLYRGLFLRGFHLRYRPITALVLSAALFTITHFNPWAVVSIFLAGMILGWLYIKSGSLLPGIVLHGLYNLASVYFVHQAVGQVGSADDVAALMNLEPFWWETPLMFAVGLAVLFAVFFMFTRYGLSRPLWQPARPTLPLD
jgi:membrane protease YdiL (CAAX protease family)